MQIGPINALFCNPEFPPARESSTFLKWHSSEEIRIALYLLDGKLLPLTDMSPEYESKSMQYHQLNTYIKSLQQISFNGI